MGRKPSAWILVAAPLSIGVVALLWTLGSGESGPGLSPLAPDDPRPAEVGDAMLEDLPAPEGSDHGTRPTRLAHRRTLEVTVVLPTGELGVRVDPRGADHRGPAWPSGSPGGSGVSGPRYVPP